MGIAGTGGQMVTPPDETTADPYAVIATLRQQLAESSAERDAALAREAAIAEVLGVISRSSGDPAPVFEAILDRAHQLCGATVGSLGLFDGTHFRAVAAHGFPEEHVALIRRPFPPNKPLQGLIRGDRLVHIPDARALETDGGHEVSQRTVHVAGARTVLSVPLRKDGKLLGYISAFRREVRPFTEQDIALLESFAAQAVIAMENAQLLGDLRTRTAELVERNSQFGERIEHQSATIDVLKAMSASPGDPQPVFNLIARHAPALCDGAGVALFEFDGKLVHYRSDTGDPVSPEARTRYLAMFPMVPTRGSITCRAILDKQIIHIPDVQADPEMDPTIKALGWAAQLSVPLMREGSVLGVITIVNRTGPFTDSQIALLQTFAEQAVIAITSAETYRALQGRTSDLQEALEQQTATAEVLQVINASLGDLAPVFDAILEKAHSLCGAAKGALATFNGKHFQTVATRGVSEAFAQILRTPRVSEPGTPREQLLNGARLVHLTDGSLPIARAAAELEGVRTTLFVPLRRSDGGLVGHITAYRQEVRLFSDKQIALLENFAAQAVIAMENARLITETREALEQQTATAEVLQVINASPGKLAPVFDAILDKALTLCGAACGILATFDGEYSHVAAIRGATPAYVQFVTSTPHRPGRHNAHGRLLRGEEFVHIADVSSDPAYHSEDPVRRATIELGGARTLLAVALRKGSIVLGFFVIYRREVLLFTDKQISLLQNFAAQAVVAIENARLLEEIGQRQEELRITFENMGDGVALFDETPRLVAWNRHFQEMFNLPNDLLEQHRTYEEHLHFLAARGDFGSGPDAEEQLRVLVATTDRPSVYERTRPDGRVLEIRRNPVPSGGFVLIYADITERKRNEAEIRAARDAAEEASRTIEAAYRDLKAAQANLIQAEKMASLGQLTAGIAHEIKNPLNFVNNFAELSGDLLDELHDAVAGNLQTEIDELTATLKGNLAKIAEHGRRADGIVRSMLEHSRGSSGERRSVNLNTLVDEALNLAYHGARARDQSFSITLQRDFDEGVTPITLVPQDVSRVLLNLFSNGFYAARRRQSVEATPGFEPTLSVATQDLGDAVEIRVRDNGIGIPEEVKDKLFQPFFTTKPTGEGTGLGLSISYDIVTQQHGGSITVESEPGSFTEFTVRLPRQ
jgi:signal transduction histidine kinase/putative methionine-R-sulfoxide reductase with GAF domain